MSYAQAGLHFMRLVPLIASTAGYVCSWDQQFAFRSWIDPQVPQDKVATILAHWYPVVFRPLLRVVILYNFGGGVLGLVNGVGPLAAGLDKETRVLYLLGSAFALGHFAWVGAVSRIIEVMWDKKRPGQENVAQMPRWLNLNWWRIHINDLPALICFLGAVMRYTAPTA